MTQAPPPPTQVPVCYRHPKRETYLSCSRCGRPICPDCMTTAPVGQLCPDCVAEGRRSLRPVRNQFGGGRAGMLGRVTTALIVINVLVMAGAIISGGLGSVAGGGLGGLLGGSTPLHDWGALLPGGLVELPSGRLALVQGFATGECWRLVTSMFLHYGLIHLAFNMYALWVIGRPLEAALGPARFLALYLISGLGGGVAVLYFSDPLALTAGASGAIFGLFMAFFFVLRRLGRDTSQVLILLAVNVVLSFAIPGISFQGHLGGLVVGGLAAAVLVYAPPSSRTRVQVAGLLGILVVLVALTVAWIASHTI